MSLKEGNYLNLRKNFLIDLNEHEILNIFIYFSFTVGIHKRMVSTGYLSHFRFPRGLPEEARRSIELFVRYLQVGLPTEPKTTWRTREVDPKGRFKAAYYLADINRDASTARVIKEKLQYMPQKGPSPLNRTASLPQIPDVGENLARFEIPLTGAGPVSAQIEERGKSVSPDGYEWGEYHMTYAANRVPGATAEFPSDLQSFVTELDSDRYLQARYYTTDPHLNALVANKNLNEMLDYFKELLRWEKGERWTRR